MNTGIELFSLKGKTALVTGVSRGIGKAIAVGLAAAGADIIGVSASLPLSGSDVENEVLALGRKFHAYQADFSSKQATLKFTKNILETFAQIDILVNNAGTIKRNPIAQHSDDDWESVLQINLSAPFVIAREIGKQMLNRGDGKIIFTASLLSFQGGINVPGYSASKGGVASLIKAFANEWAAKGVNVNGIAPGYIATDNTENLRNDPDRSAAILSRIPAGRWGKAEDLQGAAIFLASAASNYVNGEIVVVDGGWMGR